jgi:hypothetical protein
VCVCVCVCVSYACIYVWRLSLTKHFGWIKWSPQIHPSMHADICPLRLSASDTQSLNYRRLKRQKCSREKNQPTCKSPTSHTIESCHGRMFPGDFVGSVSWWDLSPILSVPWSRSRRFWAPSEGLRASDTRALRWVCAGTLGERGLGLVVHFPSWNVAKINSAWPWPWPWPCRSLLIYLLLRPFDKIGQMIESSVTSSVAVTVTVTVTVTVYLF